MGIFKMAMQIKYIKRSIDANGVNRISHVGGSNADGKYWVLTQKDAIESIEKRCWKFYAIIAGESIYVTVRFDLNDHKHLAASKAGSKFNHLFDLPEFPSSSN